MPQTAVSNLQASLTLTEYVNLQGVFPSRGGGGGSGPVLGGVTLFAGSPNLAAAPADGQLLAISQNTALFSLLGVNYGGNGTSNFGLPNLNGIEMIGTGTAPGLATFLDGQQAGAANFVLTQAQEPANLHGSSAPVSNYQPSLAITYVINTTGIFPSGNLTLDSLGVISAFLGNFQPGDEMICDGSLLSIAGNTALFALIGTTYGGDGVNTFALPDLRGRDIVGSGSGFTLGQQTGTANITLTNSNSPNPVGPDTPFNNQQPGLVLNYFMATAGIFPSSNLTGNVFDTSTPYIGQIVAVAEDLPGLSGWVACNGQVLSINQNQALFAVLGTTYGGNGTTTFAVPDLRGRTVLGTGTGNTLGAVQGANTTALLAANIAPPPAPTLALTQDTGTSASDGITRIGTVTTGNVFAGSTAQYSLDGGTTWTSSFTAHEGVNNLLARQTTLGSTSVSASLTFTLDTLGPALSGITRVGAALTNAASVSYTVTFNEAVTGVTTAAFSLDASGTDSAASITSVTQVNASTYTVTVNTGGAGQNGTIRLDLTGSAIKDVAGNAFSGGAFQTATTFVAALTPLSVAFADLNGDGKLDMVYNNENDNVGPSPFHVYFRLGNGDGTFGAQSSLVTSGTPDTVAAVDINGDGKVDIVTLSGNDGIINVLLGNGNGTFQAATLSSTSGNPITFALADVNGDGRLDMVTTGEGVAAVKVRLNSGAGAFGAPTSYATGVDPEAVALADVNGDGIVDIVTANKSANTISVLLGNGNGNFAAHTDLAAGTLPDAIALADVNGDGKMDIITASYDGASVSVRLGTGGGAFAAAVTYAVGARPVAVSIADVNGDGKLDIVTANNVGGTVSVLYGNGAGGFAPRSDYLVSSSPITLALADLNGDGRVDIVAPGPSVSVLLNAPPLVRGPAFTLDTSAAAPTLFLASDTGSSAIDNVTSLGQVFASGVEAGASLQYSINGGVTWTNSFNAVAGRNSVQARQTDAAGNVSAASAALVFTLAAPTVAITDLGTLLGGLRTITGMAELANAGTTIQLFDSGTQIGTAIVGANGMWSASVAPNAAGPHSFTAQDTDSAFATGVSAAIANSVTTIFGDGSREVDAFDAGGHYLGITRYNSSGVRTDAYAYDAAGNASLIAHFDAAQNITAWESLYAGTSAVHELIVNAIAGRTYTSFDYVYDTQGALVSRTFYTGAQVFSAAYTAYSGVARNERFYDALGASTAYDYDTANHKTGLSVYNAAGAVTDVYHYDTAGNYTDIAHFDAAGHLTSAETFYAGGAQPKYVIANGLNGIDNYSGGKPYNSLELDYTAAGATQDVTLHYNDGTSFIQGIANGAVLTSVTGAADRIWGHGINNTYAFHAAFGADTVIGFNLTGAGHDVLQFDASMFAGGNANADFVLTLASQSGSDTLIQIDASNSILVQGVSLAALAANKAADFSFV